MTFADAHCSTLKRGCEEVHKGTREGQERKARSVAVERGAVKAGAAGGPTFLFFLHSFKYLRSILLKSRPVFSIYGVNSVYSRSTEGA